MVKLVRTQNLPTRPVQHQDAQVDFNSSFVLLSDLDYAMFDMSSQSKTIVRAFVAAINAQDWRALERVVSPNFRRHSAAAGDISIESAHDLVQYLCQEFVTFPDAIETIEDIFSDDDKVAVRHRFRGTQTGQMGPFPSSNKVMDATYIAIYRVENDRIAEAWVEWDNLSGLRQLGHVPP